MTNDAVSLLIVAAGKGLRAGGPLPKQYQKIGQKQILRRTVDAFLSPKVLVDHIQIVIHPDHTQLYEDCFINEPKLLPPVFGADTRQASVHAGLKSLSQYTPGTVLIHDAARPFVSSKTIKSVIETLRQKKARAVLPVIPVTDTIKQIKNDKVERTVDRTSLFAAQTPQGFDFKLIHELHKNAQAQGMDSFTDDIALAEWHNETVLSVSGTSENFKITTENDLIYAEHLVSQQKRNSGPLKNTKDC